MLLVHVAAQRLWSVAVACLQLGHMDMADPAVSSTAVRHLFGTVLAMTNTPAGAASLGVLARAQMRVMVCSTPCVVPAQRIATDSTASPRQRVYTRYKDKCVSCVESCML